MVLRSSCGNLSSCRALAPRRTPSTSVLGPLRLMCAAASCCQTAPHATLGRPAHRRAAASRRCDVVSAGRAVRVPRPRRAEARDRACDPPRRHDRALAAPAGPAARRAHRRRQRGSNTKRRQSRRRLGRRSRRCAPIGGGGGGDSLRPRLSRRCGREGSRAARGGGVGGAFHAGRGPAARGATVCDSNACSRHATQTSARPCTPSRARAEGILE